MRVLYVVSALRDGGVESFLTNLCENNKKNLDKNEIIAVISLENKGKYGEEIKKLGINVHELNLKFNLGFFKSFLKFIKIIKIESPDIIHSLDVSCKFINLISFNICSKTCFMEYS